MEELGDIAADEAREVRIHPGLERFEMLRLNSSRSAARRIKDILQSKRSLISTPEEPIMAAVVGFREGRREGNYSTRREVR